MQRMPSVMNHNFSEVPHADIPRSNFDRSHGIKTTFDAGQLIPIFVDEALPGDTFNLNMSGFGRLATPLHPLMDNIHLETFFFAVPNRLLWDNWERFNGQQDNPGESTDFLIPQLSPLDGVFNGEGSLYDYLGIPTKVPLENVNSLHTRAYNLIYNEWFRDENLQDALTVDKGDGPDLIGNYLDVQKRGKRHDYFTSCLPWPQKGDAVSLPLGQSAPIISTEDGNPTFQNNVGDDLGTLKQDASDGNNNIYGANQSSIATPSMAWLNPKLAADLTGATASTINQIREAFQIQKLYERDARGGTRYTEIIKSHFGVTSPDARLQRPEYLGGGYSAVNINPIAQTTQTLADGTPQGNLAAMGTVSYNGHGFTKSFTEHCVLIGLVSVRADLTYQQGLNRMWSRQGRFDYYWPVLAHLGEQAVLSKEIYADATPDDETVFGYQERYAEYRYKPSTITGLFRSNADQPLDTWHLAQEFATRPTLSAAFIEENPPIDRVIAIPSEPHFIFDGYIKLNCARPMPTYSVPGLVDHF